MVRVVVFGASGMIGQAVMREALADPEIGTVLSVVRTATGAAHPKLTELVHADFQDFTALAGALANLDACLFCLGVSSAGMTEDAYRQVTVGITVAAGTVLAAASPQLTFLFVSGVGSDETETSRTMWRRVKGAGENAVRTLPIKAAYMIRPAYIQPMHGVRSHSAWTRRAYAAGSWLYPLWRRLAPGSVTTSEELARAMLHVAKHGAPTTILDTRALRGVLAPA
jgi:uncharacterized protein YbjT (DUF2867 family)